MTREELLAALLAERQDCRWFATPAPAAADQRSDDALTCARRRRDLLNTDMTTGRWVTRHGIQVWEASA